MASGGALLYRDINVRVSPDSYVFTSPSSPDSPALVVDRPTGDLRLEASSTAAATQQGPRRVSRVSSIGGILGIIQLRLDKYVLVITKATPVGRLKGHTIYRIASVELLPMRERPIRDPDEDTFLGLLGRLLHPGSAPMYFSYSLDLTNSFQRQAALADPSRPMWMRADDRFFWNRFVQTDLVELRIRGSRASPGPQPGVDPYILPVILGMLEIRPTSFRGTALTLALVSRRSRHRAGTRYFTRGLDDAGHAANYNETEQIVVLNESPHGGGGMGGEQQQQQPQAQAETQIMAHVQTRGSVPALWAEINSLHYTPKLQIGATKPAVAAARIHFDEQIRLYGDNYLINLVNQKGREARIKTAYETVVRALMTGPAEEHTEAGASTDEKFTTIQPPRPRQRYDRLHYVYFDYHSETKGGRMERARGLIDRLLPDLQAQAYFRAVDMPGRLRPDGQLEPRAYQTSVMRTNCMDCLDRTNVVQSLFGRHMLDRMLEDAGLLPRGSTFGREDGAFELVFRNLWADNADAVSGAYAGTGAMKTDTTRTGVRTRMGAARDGRIGVVRYLRNNFLDGPRQDGLDLFLGVYQPGESGLGTAGLVFADRRPVLIQAIPYLLAFSLVLVLVGLLTRPLPAVSSSAAATASRFSTPWATRIFVVFWFAVAVWCLDFIWSHGMLYVNWPKLAPRNFAQEGYQEHYVKAGKDMLLGPLMAGHARGLSTTRYLEVEAGKKRIE